MTPLPDRDAERLVDLMVEKCELLGCSAARWFCLRGADMWLVYRLLVVPTRDSDVDAHSARTVSPRRMACALRESLAEHGMERLAAGVFSEFLAGTLDDAEGLIAELLALYDRGVRP